MAGPQFGVRLREASVSGGSTVSVNFFFNLDRSKFSKCFFRVLSVLTLDGRYSV